MSSALDKMRANARRSIQNRQESLVQENHQSIGVDLGTIAENLPSAPANYPSVETLLPLETIVLDIQGRVRQVRLHKREILKQLHYLYNHWGQYTEPEAMEVFRGHRGFVRFVKEHIEQDERTSTGDVRIVAMLEKHNQADLLDFQEGGVVHSLRRIASIQDPQDEEMAEKKQRDLLVRIKSGELRREDLEREIKDFNESKETRRQSSKQVVIPRPWRIKSEPAKGRIALSGMPPERTVLLAELLKELDETQLEDFLHLVKKSRTHKSS